MQTITFTHPMTYAEFKATIAHDEYEAPRGNIFAIPTRITRFETSGRLFTLKTVGFEGRETYAVHDADGTVIAFGHRDHRFIYMQSRAGRSNLRVNTPNFELVATLSVLKQLHRGMC